jgi:hypothetical protein
MIQNRILRLLALAILCVLPAFPAIVAFTTEADWLAKATPSPTVNFSSWPCSGSYSSCSLSDMTFSSGQDLTIFTDWSGTWGVSEDKFLTTVYTPGSLLVTMGTPVTAFATQMMVTTGAINMTVTVKSDGTALSPSPWTLATSAAPTRTFFGVVSDSPGVTFNSILFTPASGSAILDNVRVGAYNDPTPSPDPIPEPGTGVLILGGAALLALGWLRKRC